jgi:hypothetical protein
MLDSDLEFAGMVTLGLWKLALLEGRIWWAEGLGVVRLVLIRWEDC